MGLLGWVTLNTDNDAFAVFTANKRVPSAESLIGLVCEPSKFAYERLGHGRHWRQYDSECQECCADKCAFCH
jgi:hypothetical protein